ncbi:FtsK/SpoIIIE domain-containing protein [Streptomyces polygonati]|uniref:FtsK/SpoIIIE domain-containing protein n=1 Tax=Streptomyces polygonati TaxID=1617087 RepID=A0ABV8HHA3_9ACTN
MRRLLTVVLPDGTEHDIALTAPESTPLARIAVRFTREWGAPPQSVSRQETGGRLRLGRAPSLHTASGPLPGRMLLADSPLRDGVRVGFGGPLRGEPAEEDGVFELLTVAGQDLGSLTRFPYRVPAPGQAPVDLLIAAKSGTRVRVPADGPVLVSASGRSPVMLGGRPVTGWRPWNEGEPLLVGGRVLEFHRTPAPTVTFAPFEGAAAGPGGSRLVRRTPRQQVITGIPAPGRARAADTPPRNTSQLIAELLLPLRSVRKVIAIGSAVREITGDRHTSPGPAALLSIAGLGGGRLWERRPAEPDFLALRCGLSVMAVPQGAVDPVRRSALSYPAEQLLLLSARLSMPQLGVLGVTGPDEGPRLLASWFAAQAAVLHSPEDLSVQVLTDPEGAARWSWLRWLPRPVSRPEERDTPRVFADPSEQTYQVGRLLKLVAERRRSGRHSAGGSAGVLLVLDGARRRLTLPGISTLLREGPAAGVYVVCLESEPKQLPAGCAAVVDLEKRTIQAATEGAAPTAFLPDLPAPPWFEQLGRLLAPLRDAAAEEQARDFEAVPLLELLGLADPEPELIATRWEVVPRATKVAVGLAGGQPFELDLVRDGPHALVAGTSGSGKSEFLRAWIGSLAVANRPDEMLFVLVDYKGGSAFGGLAALPHVTSVITDLDSQQARRILGRLAAALRDRESLLSEYGARDIADYQALRDRRGHLPPLPRLVFVVDEFAALASELPDLIEGLVATAVRGRSLGIHLVLATQRSAGVLSPDIRAATNLRVALRVINAGDSRDVIDAPDALGISPASPGRAFVRTGADDLAQMQTARLGGPGTARSHGVEIAELMPDGSIPSPTPSFADPDGPTDLDRLVEAVASAARHLGVAAPPGPLPPPLPTVVPLSEIPAPAGGRDLAPVAYGWEQALDELAPQPALFDLAGTGSLFVEGIRGSGCSQFLRTFAAAVARQHSTADVHLFGIDCGGGALLALTALPHCGAVAGQNQPDRIGRLLGHLNATVYTRRQTLAAGGFADLAAQRQAVPTAQRLPYLVLLVDHWELMPASSSTSDFMLDLTTLIRDGADVGVRVVVTTSLGRFSPVRRDLAVRDRLLLGLSAETSQRYELLSRHGVIDPELLPRSLTPGRAFRPGSGVEIQVALLDGGPSRRGQTDALDRLAEQVRDRDSGVPETRRPFRIEDTPKAADQFRVGAGTGRPVGREDVLAWLRDRYTSSTSAALLGPRRAGKSWVLNELHRRLVADGFQAVHRLVVPQPSSAIDSPDALAVLLDRSVRGAAGPAEALLDKAASGIGAGRLMFLLDEVGRLAGYAPAAVSWLRDLGQAGAWLVYTGTEKDWQSVVRQALTVPGSSFGNDVNARSLGPLKVGDALDFLTGTAANLGVNLPRETTAARIVESVGTWPFYLQAVGDAVVRAVQDNDLAPLTSASALRDLITYRLLDEWSQHFRARWAEIGRAGMAALLSAPGELPAAPSPAQRQELREVGLLGPGEVWLHDPPLLEWIARNENSLRDGGMSG